MEAQSARYITFFKLISVTTDLRTAWLACDYWACLQQIIWNFDNRNLNSMEAQSARYITFFLINISDS